MYMMELDQIKSRHAELLAEAEHNRLVRLATQHDSSRVRNVRPVSGHGVRTMLLGVMRRMGIALRPQSESSR